MARILIFSGDQQVSDQWLALLAPEHDVSIRTALPLDMTIEPGITAAVVHTEIITPVLDNLAGLTRLDIKPLLVGTDWPVEKQIYALVAGSYGYCEARDASEILLKAVNSILKGDVWIPRHLAPRIISMLARLSPSLKETERTQNDFGKNLTLLTQRERDVAKMLGEGLSNKLIASMLNISERTVKAHLTSIFQKLEVQDRLQLALLIKDHI